MISNNFSNLIKGHFMFKSPLSQKTKKIFIYYTVIHNMGTNRYILTRLLRIYAFDLLKCKKNEVW